MWNLNKTFKKSKKDIEKNRKGNQNVNLYKEDQAYLAKEKELSAQLEEATEEQQQLADYEQYTQSQEYIEEVAKSKLGLVYNNEIVFKEQNEEDN